MRGAREEFERAALHFVEAADTSEQSIQFILRLLTDSAEGGANAPLDETNTLPHHLDGVQAATLSFID